SWSPSNPTRESEEVGRGGRIRTCTSLRTEDFKSSASAVSPRPRENSYGKKKWRRRADSNRCIEVLQTSALATWLRRPEGRMSGRGVGWSGKRDSNPRPRPWQGRALPLSYSRVTDSCDGPIYYHAVPGGRGHPGASRSAVAASSGGTGLMKNPLPHSKPATF